MSETVEAIVVDEGTLPEEGENRLLAFVNPSRYALAFELADWSIDREVEELVAMAKQSKNIKAKMQAIMFLHRTAIESLVLSGTIKRISATGHDKQGRHLALTASHVSGALESTRKGVSGLPSLAQETLHAGDNHEQTPDHIHKPPVLTPLALPAEADAVIDIEVEDAAGACIAEEGGGEADRGRTPVEAAGVVGRASVPSEVPSGSVSPPCPEPAPVPALDANGRPAAEDD